MTLLTVRAAAGELGVSYSTLKRWVRTGHVRTTRTQGGHHRVAEAEVSRLLAQQRPATRRLGAPADADASLDALSARNRFPGFVDEVRVDGLLAQVRLNVGTSTITAVITADAARALRLRRGDDAIAIVKSTEVMIAKSAQTNPPRRATRRR